MERIAADGRAVEKKKGLAGLSPWTAAVGFTVLVPGTMAGLVPWLMTRWQVQPPLFGLAASRWAGAGMIVAGGALLMSAIVWFALEGVKPYPPIERLITTGPYAYVRNPMYGGVVLVMVGQGLLLGSLAVVIYGLCWLVAFYIFLIALDDPFILKRIGRDYDEYLKSVPGWVPGRRRRR